MVQTYLWRYRAERRAAGFTGGEHDVVQSPIPERPSAAAAAAAAVGGPNEAHPEEQDAAIARGASHAAQQSKRDNTDRAYRTIVYEFIEFSDYIRGHKEQALRYLVSVENILRFVWFQAYRSKRPGGKGGAAKRKDVDAAYLYFTPSEYQALLEQHNKATRERQSPPDPEGGGLGISHLEHTKSGLKKLYREQVSERTNAHHWEAVWTQPCQDLFLLVKNRKQRIAKAMHSEKVDAASSPYLLVGKLKEIESHIWAQGYSSSSASTFTSLRNGYIYKRTLTTLARGETLHGEELSDCLLVEFQGRNDLHPMDIFISQVAEGKTNRGSKLFSRGVRHKDVRMCGFGAYAFMLLYRFHHTKEFDGANCPDFTKNETWFNIKSLVALYDPASYTKGVADTNYANYIKKILIELGLPSNFQLHIGRKAGTADLELKELAIHLIKLIGNWGRDVMEKAYSCKVPPEGLRYAGDYTDNIFFCPRSVCITANLEELEESIWEWVELSLAWAEQAFIDSKGDAKCFTAFAFLTFMKRLKRVLFQDAAYIFEFHPERATHPLFQLPCFQSDAFRRFRQDMRKTCEEEVSPLDASMDKVLPGVLQGLRANLQQQKLTHKVVVDIQAEMRAAFRDMRTDITDQTVTVRGSFGRALSAAADVLTSPTGSPSASDSSPPSPLLTETTTPTEPTQPITASTAPTTAAAGAPYEGFGYTPNFEDVKTVKAVYDQWYGKGRYKNVPTAGGIAQMETKHRGRWRQHITNNAGLNKRLSRMRKTMNEMRRLREAYSYTPEQAIAQMEPVVVQLKTLWNFADAIGKKPEAELYGEVPDVEAIEAATREERERQGEEAARLLAEAADEEEDFLDGFLDTHGFPATAPESPSTADARSPATANPRSPVLQSVAV